MTDDTTRQAGKPGDATANNGSGPAGREDAGTSQPTSNPLGNFAIDFSGDGGGMSDPVSINFGPPAAPSATSDPAATIPAPGGPRTDARHG